MKKFILTSLTIAFFSLILQAQDDGFYGPEKSEDSKAEKKEIRQKKLERWSFGGSFWMSFGQERAFVEISPVALYRVTPRLRVGGGVTYIYDKFPNTYRTDTSTLKKSIKTHTYGPKFYSDFIIYNGSSKSAINIGTIIAAVEYSYLTTDELMINPSTNEIFSFGRVPVNMLLVGGGIYQPIGGKGGVSFTILYDVINDINSPYTNPIIRLGFYF